MTKDEQNGWSEYRRLVMQEIKDLKETVECNSRKLTRLLADVETLKVKSGVWGGLAGLLAVGGVLVVKLVIGD